jgi:hypothetical protein
MLLLMRLLMHSLPSMVVLPHMVLMLLFCLSLGPVVSPNNHNDVASN